MGPDPVLKFQKVVDGTPTEETLDMKLAAYNWPAGGEGTCPLCQSKVDGKGKDWKCENEECGLELMGPIF